jgi:predicted ATPase/DNA-binding CsgD family transcriptional regulator
MNALPNNLPLQLSSFIGREREIAEVRRRLETSHLVTLTGPGGAGKTRLAIHVAGMVADRFADGVWFIPLASLAVPALLPQAVASALGLLEQPDRPLMDTLTEHLRTRQLLLVLDNCEHLIESCAQLATNLLQSCPDVRILATSRESLNLDGEFVWIVPSLSVPPSSLAETELHKYDAVRLFVERSSATGTTFQMTSDNAEHVIKICRRLDGIPLAIELAAARVKVLGVEQIAARLDDTMRVLTEGKRSAPLRHQTMRAALDWSYALLSAQEQTLFCRLSVFAGGWTLQAAEQVNSDATKSTGLMDLAQPHDLYPSASHPRPTSPRAFLQPSEVLDLLTHLVEKSLVVMRYTDNQSVIGREHTRYDLLEPTRQYAWQKLAESGESQSMGQQHLNFFLMLAGNAAGELFGPIQPQRFERLEQEHDNLRAALRWALAHSAVEHALRLALDLESFWELRGFLDEGERWLGEALEAGREWLESEPTPIAHALYAKLQVRASRLLWTKGVHATTKQLAASGLAYFREMGDRGWTGYALQTLGLVLSDEGDDAAARPLVTESVAIHRELGDRRALASALTALGSQSFREGAEAEAQRYYEEASTLARALGDKPALARVVFFLGYIALNQRDQAAARAHFQESLTLSRAVQDKVRVWACLDGVAGLALICGRPQNAARLCAAVERLRVESDARPRRLAHQLHQRNIGAVRAQLDEHSFGVAWAEGLAMPPDQAVAEAEQVLNAVQSSMTPPASRRGPNVLTARELEVLRLVVAGLSDAQIAEKLVVSRRTVNTHLTSIYSKLNVKSRSAATRFALDHQLL